VLEEAPMPEYQFQMIDGGGHCFKADKVSLPDELSAWQRAFSMAQGAAPGSEVRVVDEQEKIIFALGAFGGPAAKG
jgi:hypothetical protein